MTAHFVETATTGSPMPTTTGRSETARSTQLGQGLLSWMLVQQSDADGHPIFEYATTFRLDGRLIKDRSGERLLDSYQLRVDGSWGQR
jgi:hypothetical protein